MNHVTYTAIFEQSPDGGWGATVPDLPIILVGSPTLEGCQQLMREAIAFHIEGLKEQGLPIPQPKIQSFGIDVAA